MGVPGYHLRFSSICQWENLPGTDAILKNGISLANWKSPRLERANKDQDKRCNWMMVILPVCLCCRHTCIYNYIYIHTYLRMYMFICAYSYVVICSYLCIHMYINVCIYIYIIECVAGNDHDRETDYRKVTTPSQGYVLSSSSSTTTPLTAFTRVTRTSRIIRRNTTTTTTTTTTTEGTKKKNVAHPCLQSH